MANLLDRKQFEIKLFRNRNYIGDLGRLARDLTWQIYRNPLVGYNSLSFKVDRKAFGMWCEQHSIDEAVIITPIFTDCQIWVKNTPEDLPVCVAHGFLSNVPNIVANVDVMDYEFTFKDQFLKLQYADRVPNGTKYIQWNTDDVVYTLMAEGQKRQGANYGFTKGVSLTLGKIDREYTDWKPVSEALAELCDNTTGGEEFDMWIDENYKLNIAKPRGKQTGLKFVYPYDVSSDNIPMVSPPTHYNQPEFFTAIRAVGEGQGDAAVSVFLRNEKAIAEYGFIEGYRQYSSISRIETLRGHAQADLKRASDPDPAPNITVNGVFIDWSKLSVGDFIDFEDKTAVKYGASGNMRIKRISVNCDENRNETVAIDTEKWTNNG